jgi:hypothetical protein
LFFVFPRRFMPEPVDVWLVPSGTRPAQRCPAFFAISPALVARPFAGASWALIFGLASGLRSASWSQSSARLPPGVV